MQDYVKNVQILRDPESSVSEREKAFGGLMERFRGMVYSSALGFLGDEMQADDAVQETFLTAWRQIDSLREPAAFPGWVRRIAIWQCHHYRRSERPTVDIDALVDRLGDGRDLEAELGREQLLNQIRELLWDLSRPHREILILHYLEDYGQVELAQLLELSEGAVRKRLHDARSKVRGLYDSWLRESLLSTVPAAPKSDKPDKWRRMMTASTPDAAGRTAQEKIDAIHRPKWCVAKEEGRLYWDLICAAIRNDVDTLQGHISKDPDCARLEFWYVPPIHFAVREGSLGATQLLWEAYAFDEVTDLITMAEDRGYTSIADYLREQVGANAATSDLRLHEAVEAEDHEELERLLKEVPGIGGQLDPRGRTALHLAVIAGDLTAIDTLLNGGVEVDVADHEGFRAVHYACWTRTYWGGIKEDASELTRVLLEGGAADSPTLAAVRGDLEAMRAFLQADSLAVNDGDTLQKRPLSTAIEAGHRDLVRFLVDQGADPTLPEARTSPYGSALMTASVGDDLEIARWLLDAGADPNGYIDSSGTPASRAGSDAMRGLLYGHGGRPAEAWVYAQKGDLNTLAAILRYREDPFSDEESEYLTTPYTAIVSGFARRNEADASTDAHEAMLEMFLQRSYPMPKVLTECKSYLYSTPHMTRQLLEHDLDPNLNDWQRRTPLHDLSKGGRYFDRQAELIRMFLEFGADIDAIDEEDRSTPLGIAAREGNKEVVELLLEAGADPTAAGASWARPLAWAERRGHLEIVEMLGKKGRG